MPHIHHLRWESAAVGETGWSNQLAIASIGQRPNGRWWYIFNDISVKHISKSKGDVADRRSAVLACERGWTKWLSEAGLVPDAA